MVNIWRKCSQMCVLALIAIATMVAVRIYICGQAWIWIIIYWLVLTLKNAFDYAATR